MGAEKVARSQNQNDYFSKGKIKRIFSDLGKPLNGVISIVKDYQLSLVASEGNSYNDNNKIVAREPISFAEDACVEGILLKMNSNAQPVTGVSGSTAEIKDQNNRFYKHLNRL